MNESELPAKVAGAAQDKRSKGKAAVEPSRQKKGTKGQGRKGKG